MCRSKILNCSNSPAQVLQKSPEQDRKKNYNTKKMMMKFPRIALAVICQYYQTKQIQKSISQW